MITLAIDNKPVTVTDGTLVIDAAKAAGVNIPAFCYHPKLKQVGMCRMCLVEIGRPVIDRSTGDPLYNEDGSLMIKFSPNLETACTTIVVDNMQVITNSEKVKAARADILEFLLTSHPLDCPVCDKGGECPLQNLTMRYGLTQSRFEYENKHHLMKRVPLGDLIYLDQERCIQCGRCVRFQDEVAGEPVLGFSSRGRELRIISFSDPEFDSIFSGNTTDICPVGALTTADFRFSARSWEMEETASVCNHCAVGCNIVYNTRQSVSGDGRPEIKRVMPRQNESINELWICDKGRFGFHYINDKARLEQPLIRKDGSLVPTNWETAINYAANELSGQRRQFSSIVGGSLSNESLFCYKELSNDLDGKSYLYSYMAGGEHAVKYGLTAGSNIKDLGADTTVLVVASDLYQEAPVWWLRIKQASERGVTLIVINPRETKLDKFADHCSYYEYGNEVETIQKLITGKGLANEEKNIFDAVHDAKNLILIFGSEGLGLRESANLVEVCSQLLQETGHYGRANNGLIGVWPKANTQGAWEMGFEPINDINTLIDEKGYVWIAGADPVGDYPTNAELLHKAAFVVVNDLFLTETAKLADIVFPVASVIESEGTFTSGERIVQRFYRMDPIETISLPDHEIVDSVKEVYSKNKDNRKATDLFIQITKTYQSYSNLDYEMLSVSDEQTPIISREDLYYGGTAYENLFGTGLHLNDMSESTDHKTTLLDQKSIYFYENKENRLLLLPTTRLYDHGQMIKRSKILDHRQIEPVLFINIPTAQFYGLETGQNITIRLNGIDHKVSIGIDDTIIGKVGLIPRSSGISMTGPIFVEIMK